MSRPLPPAPLLPARVHEATGPSAAAFALIRGVSARANLMWVRPGWGTKSVFPDGLAGLLPPNLLLIAETGREVDRLAIAEEALRDGAIPLVVIEITRPLNLREGRRLQLAAKAGGTTGLCLIPEGMGSGAAETRWHCAPVFAADGAEDSTLMRWEIKKNKSGTVGAWHVRWNWQAHCLDVVSPAPLGADSARLHD